MSISLRRDWILTENISAIRLEVLRALVGRIPPHPLWAELLWQRQEELSKRMAAAQHPVPHPTDTSRHPQY